MKLSSLRPLLRTQRLDETIAFYTQVMGFTLAEKNEEWGWAALYKDDVAIMVASPNAHFPFGQALFTGSFYFTTDEVDTLWEQVKDKVNVCYEIGDFEWQMREFAI